MATYILNHCGRTTKNAIRREIIIRQVDCIRQVDRQAVIFVISFNDLVIEPKGESFQTIISERGETDALAQAINTLPTIDKCFIIDGFTLFSSSILTLPKKSTICVKDKPIAHSYSVAVDKEKNEQALVWTNSHEARKMADIAFAYANVVYLTKEPLEMAKRIAQSGKHFYCLLIECISMIMAAGYWLKLQNVTSEIVGVDTWAKLNRAIESTQV